MITIKRAYQPYDEQDGFRILIDRLWPRGLKKSDAHIDLWAKDIAPSNELRKWFGHEPEKWISFSNAYRKELKNSISLMNLHELVKEKLKTTLVYAARDEQHNHALVLSEILKNLK